jgi:MinD-like ATPase involved in chromosome partitioning or flagellar assembly
MGRARVFFAALLALGALAVLAGPASATTSAAAPAANSAKFCKAIQDIDLDSANVSSLSDAKKQYKALASKLKSAAKNAPSNVKTATNNLANLYSALGGGDISALSKLQTSGYSKSVSTFTSYLAENCN